MIDREPWNRFIAITPLLFHVTTAVAVEAILRDGLCPGSDLERRMWDDFFATRDEHVYLAGQGDVHAIQVRGEPAILAVDLSQLDPSRVNPDEDIVAEHLARMVAVPPPHRDTRNPDAQRGALARWAERTPGFDRSDVTERSLFDHKRLAYRGSIGPEAITVARFPSQPISLFLNKVGHVLRQLPEPPPAGMGLTEAARARAVAGKLIDHLVGDIEVRQASDLASHDSAVALAEQLRDLARDLRHREPHDPDRSVAVGAAARIADAAAEIDPDVGSTMALMTATTFGEEAGEEIASLVEEDILAADRAHRCVVDAVAAASAIGWRTGWTDAQRP